MTLLTEKDYNLLTTVDLKFHFYYFVLNITSLIPTNLLFFLCNLNFVLSVQSHLLFSPVFSHRLLCTFLYILHQISQRIFSCIILEYVNYFTLLSFLLKYSFSIRIINLDFTFYFQWSLSQVEHARIIWAGLSNPTPDIRKAMTETEVTDPGRCQHNISI